MEGGGDKQEHLSGTEEGLRREHEREESREKPERGKENETIGGE